MTEETETNDATADAAEAGEDTALAAAAKEAAAAEGEAEKAEVAEEGADKSEEGASEAEEASGAPDTYDTAAWQMPEGIEFDKEGFEAVEPVLRDLNLSNDQAGKLMAAYGEKIVPLIQQRTEQAMDEAGAELRANLARDLQADKEVGGKNLEESRSHAAKAIAHFLPDKNERAEFSKFLNESGFGNNRFLMRIVAGAGRSLAEASTPAATTATEPPSNAEVFYGKKKG